MRSSARARNVLFAAVVASIVCGCASQSNDAVPQGSAPNSIVLPQAGPPACKGQKTTKTYSSAEETLSSKGGSLCIPKFRGLGGSLEYPGAKPSGKVTVTSTTIDNGFPYPGSGTPVLYLQIELPAATQFASKLRAGGGLTGKPIKAKSDYTVFSNYIKYNVWYAGSSCYAVAKHGKHGGVLAGLSSVLEGQSFGGPYTLLLEVYPNQQSQTLC
jgi:hypothetical protein